MVGNQDIGQTRGHSLIDLGGRDDYQIAVIADGVGLSLSIAHTSSELDSGNPRDILDGDVDLGGRPSAPGGEASCTSCSLVNDA